MNDIDDMPSKCQNCPYWEFAKKPYCCDDCTNPSRDGFGNMNDNICVWLTLVFIAGIICGVCFENIF